MADQKELKLIINAQNMSGKTLSEVSASIDDLNDKIKEQATLAGKGEGSTRSLTESVKQLGEAEKALLAKQALADNLTRTSEAMAAAKIRVEELRAEIVKLKSTNEVSPVANFTDDLKKLERELANIERAMGGKLQNQFAAAEANAAKAGISTKNLAESNLLAEQSARKLAEGYSTTSKALLDYDAAKARNAAIAKAELETERERVALAEQVERQVREEAAAEAALVKSRNAALAKEIEKTERERIALAEQAEKQIKEEAAAESLLAKARAAARAQAQSATASARGATGLAVATQGAATVSPELSNKLNAIINPAQQARTSLAGIEDEVGKLNSAISSISAPMSQYRDQLNQLQQSQRAIAGQGAAIDAYRQQIAALRQSRAAFVEARGEVLRYAEQLRQVDQPSDELSAGLRKAQAALSATTTAMQTQITKTRALREELGAAGIKSNSLVEAESRLAAAARTNVTSIDSLTKAYAKYGDAKDKAARSGGDLGGGGGSGERTTLGYMQRLKGQVLATALAYASLQGAINGVRSVINASVEKTSIEMQLGALLDTTDTKKIGAEYEYLHDKALYYGQSIDTLAGSYARFATAAKGQNISVGVTKRMFEELTQTFTVFHLSGEKSSRVMTQLTQMIGKGKIQAEDLQTVVEGGLVQAPTAMAKGLQNLGVISKTSQNALGDMYKMMKNGALDAKIAVMALTDELAKQTAPQLPAAMQSMNSEMERFQIRITDFQQKVAEAGFGEAFTAFLVKLNALLADTKSAKTFSDLLVGITKLLGFMLDHLKEIVITLEFFAARKVILAIGTLGTNLLAMANNARIAAKEVGLMRGIVVGLGSGGAFGLAATAAAGAAVALYEYWQQAEAATTQTKALSLEIDKLRQNYKDLDAEGVRAAAGVANAQRNLLMSQQMATQQRIAGLQSRMQATGPKDLTQINVELTKETNTLKLVNAELAKQEDLMRKLKFRDEQIKGGDVEKKAEADAQTKAIAADAAKAKAAADAEKLAGQLKAKEDSLMNQLDAMRAKVEKRETDNLKSRLASIGSEYAKLFRAIDDYSKAGGRRGGEFKATATGLRTLLEDQEREKFDKAYSDKYAKLRDGISQIEAKFGRKEKGDLQEQLNAVEAEFAPLRAALDETVAAKRAASSATESERTYLDDILNAERARIDNAEDLAKAQAERKVNADLLADKEKEMNDILAARESVRERIGQQEAAGDISHLEAIEQNNAALAEYQVLIDAAAERMLAFAETIKDALDPEVYDKFVEGIKKAAGSADKLQQSLYSAAEANKDIAAGLTSTVSTLAQGLGKAVTGADSLGNAFKNAGKSFANFAADFLFKIGEMIIQEKILESIGGKSGSGWGGIASAFVGWATGSGGGMSGGGAPGTASYIGPMIPGHHNGGIVGAATQSRTGVSPRAFTGAPRYHSGGVVGGLRYDEQAAILQKGEEVLTKDDPRHAFNAGKSNAGGSTTQPQNIKIMNMIDSGSVMSEGLATQEGTKAIINFVRANRVSIKQLLG